MGGEEGAKSWLYRVAVRQVMLFRRRRYRDRNKLENYSSSLPAVDSQIYVQWLCDDETTEQVKQAFVKEKSHLLALPSMLFPCFEEGRRSVHRDQHVEVMSAYYSVPSEYVRREVWVRYTTRCSP